MTHVSTLESTAEQLERVHRAIGHKYPLRLVKTDMLSLFGVSLPALDDVAAAATSPLPAPAGSAVLSRDFKRLFVRCAQDSVLAVASVQRPMKRVVSVHDYVLGRQLKPHSSFVLEPFP